MKFKYEHFFGSDRNTPKIIEDFESLHQPYAKTTFYYDLKFKRINLLILAYHKGKPVAFTAVNQQNGNWYFRGCFVHPDFRGNGLQNKLALKAYELLRSRGIKQVTTMADTNNVVSQHNIEKRGMSKTGRRKTNYHYKQLL